MFQLKIIAQSKLDLEKNKCALDICPEILELILSFCDIPDILNVRLANSYCLRVSKYVLAKKFQLNWNYCCTQNISPLVLTSCFLTRYLTNLDTPINESKYAMKCIQSHHLNEAYVTSFLKAFEHQKKSIPYLWTEVGSSFAGMLSDGRVVINEFDGDTFTTRIIESSDSASIIYRNDTFKLYLIHTKKNSFLFSNPFPICPNSKDLLPSLVIRTIFETPLFLLAEQESGEITYVTHASDRIPYDGFNGRTIHSLIQVNDLNVALLDDNNVLLWGHRIKTGAMLRIPYNKVGSFHKKNTLFLSGYRSFSILLGDSRTIVIYRYLTENYPNLNLHRKVTHFYKNNEIKTVISNELACVAWFYDGKIMVWGEPNSGGTPPILPHNYRVKSICYTQYAFAVLLEDGRVICWGDPEYGGISPKIPEGRYVKGFFANLVSFVAHLDDDTILTWGHESCGKLPDVLKGRRVRSVFSNFISFLALLEDDLLCYWGQKSVDGVMIQIQGGHTVKSIMPTDFNYVLQLDNNNLMPVGMPGTCFPNQNDFTQPLLTLPHGAELACVDRK